MHVVYADMQDTKLGGCVCMYDVAGVTILLSQTVFSLLVAHVLTRTSEAVPLIGTDPSFLPTYPDEAKFDAVGSFLVLNIYT